MKHTHGAGVGFLLVRGTFPAKKKLETVKERTGQDSHPGSYVINWMRNIHLVQWLSWVLAIQEKTKERKRIIGCTQWLWHDPLTIDFAWDSGNKWTFSQQPKVIQVQWKLQKQRDFCSLINGAFNQNRHRLHSNVLGGFGHKWRRLPLTWLCVLFYLIKPILGNRSGYSPEVSSRAMGARIHNLESPILNRSKGARTSSPCPPSDNLGWPDPHPGLHLNVAGYTGPLLFLFKRTHNYPVDDQGHFP